MFRGLKRLLNARSFTSSKDPQALRDQFKKMTEQHSQKPSEAKEDKPDIKLTDQHKATEDLKSKFDMFKNDLSKNTGQAKGVFEKLYETAKTIKKEDIQFFNRSQEKADPLDDRIKEELAKKNLRDQQAKSQDSSENTSSQTLNTEKLDEKLNQNTQESPNETKETKETKEANQHPKKSFYQTFCHKFPKTSYYTDVCGRYVGDLWKETFPNPETKLEKLVKIHEIRKMSVELDEKLAKGEITEEDLPAWKKSALMVQEEKKSSWQKLREKLPKSTPQSKIIAESEAVKTATTKIKSTMKGIKTEVSEMKEAVNEVIEDSNIGVVNTAKSLIRENLTETPDSRALRIMRQHDPDFDLFGMVDELPIFVHDLFNKVLAGDKEYMDGVCFGQAREHLNSFSASYASNSKNQNKSKVVSVLRTTFIGCNADDKSDPKVSYTLKISWEYHRSNAEEELENAKSNFSNLGMDERKFMSRTYFVTIGPHPDPDILKYRHPWKFVAFFPAEALNAIGGSR